MWAPSQGEPVVYFIQREKEQTKGPEVLYDMICDDM